MYKIIIFLIEFIINNIIDIIINKNIDYFYKK